jgi:hypothetical protein
VLKFNGEMYKKNSGVFTPWEVYLNNPDPKGVNIRKKTNGKDNPKP